MAAFVSIFFENFSKFKRRAFHMAGESYGVRYSFTVMPVHLHLSDSFFFFTQGRYIPLFAAEIYDQNAKLEEAGLTPINLTSVIIGMVFVQSIDQLHDLLMWLFAKVMGLRTLRLWYLHTTIWHARLHPFHPSLTSRKLIFYFIFLPFSFEIWIWKTNGSGPVWKWKQQ